MIGEFLIRSNKIYFLTLNVILGSIIFNAVMYGARSAIYYIPGMVASDLKLVQVILVVGCLVAIRVREYLHKRKMRK